jgi:general secretion pathway protein F
MRYHVHQFDPQSRTASDVVIDAADERALTAILSARGAVVLRISAAGVDISRKSALFDVRLYCRELSSLLNAGMTIVEALTALVARAGTHPNVHAYGAVLGRLREGKVLSGAMEQSGLAFPSLLIAAVRASERSGRISDALSEYLRYEEMVRISRQRVINAGIYPLLVVLFGVIVCLFLLGYVVPRFSKVYDDFGGSRSLATQIILGIGTALNDYFWWFVFGSVAIIAAAALASKRINWRIATTRLLLRFKWFEALSDRFQLARMFRTVAMLLRGGFPLVEALRMASDVAFDPKLKRRLSAAAIAVTEGAPLGRSLGAHSLIDEVGLRLIAVGERNGQLDNVLEVIADEYQLELDNRIERMTRLIEPVLIFTVAVIIGAIVVMMYLPIFDLASGVL